MKKLITTALLITGTGIALALAGCGGGGTTPSSAAADIGVDCSAVASTGVTFHAASVQADMYFNVSSANGQAQGALADTARNTAQAAFEAAKAAVQDKCVDLANADMNWTAARAAVLLATANTKAAADAALVTAQASWDAAVAAA